MEKERRKEEKKKKEEGRREEEEIQVWKFGIHVWNSCLEHLFCLELLDLLVRKPPQLFLCLCLG